MNQHTSAWKRPVIGLWNRFLVNQTALLISLLLVGIIGIWGLLANAVQHENQQFRTLLQHQVRAGLNEQSRSVGKVLVDYAVWNELADKVNREHPDFTWLSANLTPSIYTNMDIDAALLIDPARRQIDYAIMYGRKLAAPRQAMQLSAATWRWIDAAMRTPGQKARLTSVAYQDPQDSLHGRQLLLLAIQPVENERGEIPRQHGKLMLFARVFDPPLLQNMSGSYLLETPRIIFSPERAPARMSLPISGLDGQPVAWFSWGFTPPGDALLARLMPGVIILCLILFVLGSLLGQQARRLQEAEGDTLGRLRRQGFTLRSIVEQSDGQKPSLSCLQDLCQQIVGTLNADWGCIWRFDADRQMLRCIAAANPQGPCPLDSVDIPVNPDYLHRLQAGRYLVMDDRASTDLPPLSLSAYPGQEQRSQLDAAVRVGQQMHGILTVAGTHPRVWTQDAVNFIASAADALALMSETSARQEAEGELTHLFYHDRVTGLPNGHKLRQHLDVLTSLPHSHAGACILVVLSNLATVIEAYGSSVGAQVIARLAARLDDETRAGEMAARMGDTRFGLWLNGKSEAELGSRLDHLQQRLSEPLAIDGLSVHPRFLIGASLFPGDGDDADSLLRQAGSAIQHASQLSRQSWVRFNSGLNDELVQKHRLQMALREALDLAQLHLHYQPFVALDTGRVMGAEALLRWTHPEHGAISPAVFIPLAEEDEALINALGAWVLEQACAQVGEWRRLYSPALFIAVNVSVRQMETPGFHMLVANALARHRLPADAIELELTESIAASSAPELEYNLSSLQNIGVSLAIDDFGTGYASFSYLRRFPAVRLKVDRQFFDGVPENIQSSNLVRMIVAMGHVMGAQVIGEGVESAEQVAFLKAIGGDFAQGYFFSRPLPPQEMAAVLARAPYPVP